MPLIIEPGQRKNLAFDIRTAFDEGFEMLQIVRPHIYDWRNGVPTRAHEYDDTREIGPVLDEVTVQDFLTQRRLYDHGIHIPLDQKDVYTAEGKLTILENFKRQFINGANHKAATTFLQETVAKIDFAGEYAENVVPWDYINPADHDNIRGLSFEQILYAQNLLESKRLPSSNLVLIAPVAEKLSLMKSNALLYSTLGVQGAPLNSQITNDIMGIPIWWVPNTFFIECGLSTDDVDGEHANHHGIYVYMVNRDDLYFITSIGSEVLGGRPWLHENPEHKDNAVHVIIGRYAVGAAMKNFENCIRIDCRLD